MTKSPSKVSVVKNVTIYSTYLIIFWAFYRFLFQLPDNIEELFVKPIIWLLPVFYFVKKEGFGFSSVGLTFKNLIPSLTLSGILGAIFVIEGLATNFLKYGHFNFGANIGYMPLAATFGLSLATAFSEEVSFRGYIFSRLSFALKNELLANLLQTLLWTGIHVPIAFFVWGYTLPQGLIYLFLTAIFGFGAAFVFGRTKNVWGSILLHILWEWPIILFR